MVDEVTGETKTEADFKAHRKRRFKLDANGLPVMARQTNSETRIAAAAQANLPRVRYVTEQDLVNEAARAALVSEQKRLDEEGTEGWRKKVLDANKSRAASDRAFNTLEGAEH